MSRLAQALVAAAIGVAISPSAHADLADARDRLLHGDYAAARAAAEEVRGAERDLAQLLLARIELQTGDYAAAERRVAPAARRRGKAPATLEARAALAELLLLTGRYDDALRELEAVRKLAPAEPRPRYLLGRAYLTLGRATDAAAVFESFFEGAAVERFTAGTASGEEAMYLALASRHLASYEDANDAFREAVRREPSLLEANIAWGYLFLEKYAAAYAEQSFDDVLKTDPHHPDAHAGMAQVKLEQNYDVAAARDHLAQALSVNPRHLPSLRLRATLEIDANDWAAARATLDEIFAVNPSDLESLALSATIHWLRDETRDYDTVKQRALAINPRYAELFHIVARSAVREHRYPEAIELENQAVALDARFFAGMQEIGTGHLRLGDEREGLDWLRKAWEGDPYNVRTHNLLELFENVIPRDYVFAATPHFRIRYHRSEQKLLARYLEPLLERAYADLTKRYGLEPTTPTTVELYQNPEHYSVRTVGLPNLGALGVCFGRVITTMSPASGNINWAMIVWHELSHVFAIQASRSRVPRWFTEGLSEYETVLARPEWRRENDADVWAAMDAGALPSVADLNAGFMRPDLDEVVVAYHLSSLAIQFIAETWGFRAVVKGLELYGRGKETPAVIAEITQLAIPAFDERFRAWLRARLAHYAGSFRLPTRGFDDLQALEAAAQAAPDSAAAHAAVGLGQFFAGDAGRASDAMSRALVLEPANKIALFVLGELALRAGDPAAARRHYEALIAAGGDGFEPRGRLGLIAIQAGDLVEAERQLAIAKRLDPERSDPYALLAEAYDKARRSEDALREYERYADIEQMQHAPLRALVGGYAKLKQWDKVRAYGERALDINPYDGEVLLELGKAYALTGDPKRGVFSFDSALLVEPPLRRPALAHLGKARAYLMLGDKLQARAALAKALALEPDNRSARRLRKRLR
jgi:tetratricopeptide (TPR) repeat protein